MKSNSSGVKSFFYVRNIDEYANASNRIVLVCVLLSDCEVHQSPENICTFLPSPNMKSIPLLKGKDPRQFN